VGIVFKATVTAGSGNQVFDYRIDSRAPVRISTPQQSIDDYDVELIWVNDLPDGVHAITLTNVGDAPFQVDMFKYLPSTVDSGSPGILPYAMFLKTLLSLANKYLLATTDLPLCLLHSSKPIPSLQLNHHPLLYFHNHNHNPSEPHHPLQKVRKQLLI
jgi:hypothetical protein